MQKTQINWLAILACVILNMLIGMLWFGPLFAKQWMELHHLSEEMAMNAGPMPYVEAVLAAILVSMLFSNLFPKLGINTFMDGLKHGLLFSFVFFFLPATVSYAFSFQPVELGLIDHLYPVVSFTLMGGIVVAMRKEAKV